MERDMDDELAELIRLFDDGSGFGDPDARRNAETRMQIVIARQQRKTAARLNILTLLLVVVGLLNVLVLLLQLLKN
jgi:hypothetical protein